MNYNSKNIDALSNGDENGKGQIGDTGAVGSKTDINARKELITKNKYGDANRYGRKNANALSDGDEFGKGTGVFLDTSNGGSRTDNAERISEVKLNEYQPNKPYTTPSA